MPDKDKPTAAERRAEEQREHEQQRAEAPESPATSGPVTYPTDMPPPPGPQLAGGQPVTDAPSSQPQRQPPKAGTEGGPGFQEGASAYLPDGTPIDNVGIVRATVRNPNTGQDMEVTAAATPPEGAYTGAAGQSLGLVEMGGGRIARTLSPRPQPSAQVQAQTRLERAGASQVAQRLGGLIGRPLLEWGLVGQGDVVAGHMILVDLESGEKVRVLPGTRIEDDRIFANARQLPDWLVTGEALGRIFGHGGGPSGPALPEGQTGERP